MPLNPSFRIAFLRAGEMIWWLRAPSTIPRVPRLAPIPDSSQPLDATVWGSYTFFWPLQVSIQHSINSHRQMHTYIQDLGSRHSPS